MNGLINRNNKVQQIEKMQKLIFYISIFITLTINVKAQDIKVNVFYKNESLPYTYISVNGTPIAIANAAGVANVPMDKLNLGDTITSKMIGLLPVSVIYDQQIQLSQECKLVHTEDDVYNLSEVVVTFYDHNSSRRIFRRNVNANQGLLQNCLVNANFTSTITLANGVSCPVNGSFVLENYIPRRSNKPLSSYHFNTPPQIETINDTTNLSRELQESIRYIYWASCGIIGQLYKEYRIQSPYTNMSYLGLRGERHFFRYSCFYPNDFAVLQILFEADAESQELTNAKYTTLSLRDDRDSNYTISISCRKLTKVPTKNWGRSTITVAENIEAYVINPNGTIIDLKMNDISIKFQE